jgi:hypothetical protein
VHAVTFIVVECTSGMIRLNYINTRFPFIEKKKVHVYSTIEGHGNDIFVLRETGERMCCVTENLCIFITSDNF